MSTKLLKAAAYVLAFSSASGQFFVDFHSCGTLACRFATSTIAELSPQPAVGVGLGARLRSWTALSLDLVLAGGRLYREGHEEFLLWAELHYRLLLNLRYRHRPMATPTVAVEWAFPFGLPAAEGMRADFRAELITPRFGLFGGASFPLAHWGGLLHMLAGAQWMLRAPTALRSAFTPEVRLIWESP